MMRVKSGLGALLVLSLALAGGAHAQEVTVSGGRIKGTARADGSQIFYGVPYAEAPAGSLRWKPPVSRKPWSGTLDATQRSAACVQADVGWNKSFTETASEDCLSLSIRTPSVDAKAKLPVLVYIHGGMNALAGAGEMEDEAIHRDGVVFIKVQYRLGVFGFLSLDALNREDPHKASGNYALLDQIAALEWIQKNVQAFGGDPDNVTITGNSAGALNALFLTLSPRAKGLFNKAILQAGAPGKPISLSQNVAIGNEMLRRLKLPANAKGLAALRQMPAVEIIDASKDVPAPAGVDQTFLWEMQILDGYVMSLPYDQAYLQGAAKDVAIIIGSNTQEIGADRPAERGEVLINNAFGPHAAEARRLYGYTGATPPKDDSVYGSVTTQVITDTWFRCPVSVFTGDMQKHSAKVWRYEFGLGNPGSGKPPEHTSEMPYVYKAVPTNAKPLDWPPIQRYWINFIKTGNPNGANLPNWPTVGNTEAYLSFMPDGTRAAAAPRTEICTLLKTHNPNPQSPIAPM